MTEALMINRNITRSTINEAMVNASLRSSEICPRAGTIEMDVLLCDYVRLRKVRTDEKVKKTKIDKKLKVRTTRQSAVHMLRIYESIWLALGTDVT